MGWCWEVGSRKRSFGHEGEALINRTSVLREKPQSTGEWQAVNQEGGRVSPDMESASAFILDLLPVAGGAEGQRQVIRPQELRGGPLWRWEQTSEEGVWTGQRWGPLRGRNVSTPGITV